MLDIAVEMLKANPGNLALVVILGIVWLFRDKLPPSIVGGGSEPMTEAIIKKIDERVPAWVAHSWSAATPHLAQLRAESERQQRQIDSLDLAREEVRVITVRLDGRLLNLESGQASMNGKLDRLLDRER